MYRKLSQTLSQTIVPLMFGVVLIPSAFAQGIKPRNTDIENIGKRDITKGSINFTSFEKEIEIGRAAAAQLEQGVVLDSDPTINEYVNRVAQDIAKNSDSKFPITIKVIHNDTANATALPGGFIYLNTGALKSADSEAEMAWFIAQMVAHVAARHATENQAKATLMQVGLIPAIVQTGGVAATAIQEAAQLGLPMTMFHFSKQAASEADFLGLEYLYKTGYDPQVAITSLQKLQAMEAIRPSQSGLFDTFPPTADRIKAAEKTIKDVLPTRTNNILNTPEFDAIKSRIK